MASKGFINAAIHEIYMFVRVLVCFSILLAYIGTAFMVSAFLVSIHYACKLGSWIRQKVNVQEGHPTGAIDLEAQIVE